jgi:hypothetical protein
MTRRAKTADYQSAATTRSADYQSAATVAVLVLAAALPALVRGQGTAPPVFVAHTAEGKDLRGPLTGLQADWSVRLGEGHDVRGPELVGLRQVGVALPPVPASGQLLLANGDHVGVSRVRLAGERLHFRHPDLDGGRETSVPLAAVSVLWRTAPDRADDPVRLRRQLAAESRPTDVVLLRNGDRLEGVLSGLDADRVTLEVGKKVLQVPLGQVSAVALSTDLVEALRPKGVYGCLVLTGDAGRLSVTAPACADGAHLEATTAFGARLKVPLGRVAALDVRQGPAVYLSDLKPARYEFAPFLDEHWVLSADANAAGHDLVLAGSTYAKGIGLHSQSRVRYMLSGQYRRFEAVIGLDDHDGRGGSVRIGVLADGKPLDLGPDRDLTAATGPRSVSVSVAGVRELTLVVEFGRNGNVQDVVNWADARLLR